MSSCDVPARAAVQWDASRRRDQSHCLRNAANGFVPKFGRDRWKQLLGAANKLTCINLIRQRARACGAGTRISRSLFLIVWEFWYFEYSFFGQKWRARFEIVSKHSHRSSIITYIMMSPTDSDREYEAIASKCEAQQRRNAAGVWENELKCLLCNVENNYRKYLLYLAQSTRT